MTQTNLATRGSDVTELKETDKIMEACETKRAMEFKIIEKKSEAKKNKKQKGTNTAVL